MVRARLRKHLENLKSRFPDLLENCQIQDSIGTDYKYRIFLNKDVWTEVLEKLGADIDYDNFKSAVFKSKVQVGKSYQHSLPNVWDIMYKIQK